MRNYNKIPFLFTIVVFSGCKSSKMIEESSFSYVDSCAVESTVNMQTLTASVAVESIAASCTQDHFDFQDGSGEIQIHPDGEVTVKGLKSASLAHTD